jgi:NADH-quinone oxidoreductase subunit J
MVTKPRFASEANHVNGLAAVALFVVLAAVMLTSNFPSPEGFPQGAELVSGIGYAMFNLQPDGVVPSEPMLVAFEIIDIVLVAALVAAVMLARRSDAMAAVKAMTDGGQDVTETEEGEN